MTKRKTKREFIKDARKIHGRKYNYSKVNYIDNKTKVIIICKEHGEFLQIPNSHLKNHGCSRCIGNNNKTTKEFIKDAEKIHGERYDYSKVNYKNAKTNIIIICKKHGEFYQSPTSHLNGSGCPECSCKKRTMEEFIRDAENIHGKKYNYSKVNYINTIHKVIIICKEHGEFLQTPNAHLNKHGCPECNKSFSNTEIFIKKAKEIHKNRYNYSKVKYIKAKEKVIIICKEHGEFLQTPDNHLSGQNCPKCAGNQRKTTTEFIKEAKIIHGKRYNYDKVKYINHQTKIKIICNEHGEFLQTPNQHLSGAACSKCTGNKKKTTEEFIKDAKKIHGERYDYSKVKYKNAKTNIIIICKEHGEFLQSPDSHLGKSGCPKCNGNISSVSQKWLDNLKIPKRYREKPIIIDDKKFIVDAFDEKNNIVYEFNGDFWHGNPNKYNADDINPVNHIKFGELYRRTIEKKELLEKNGFIVISIWESDFK